MSAGTGLARLLAGQGPILLDFDGPVCSIFAGHPAPTVAEELRAVLRGRGIELPGSIAGEPDPLEVLRWTGSLGQLDVTGEVEDALRAAELHAARSAAPTPYAREVVVAARQAGKPVAVVSNNSEPAIVEYLTAQRLAGHIAPVIGRAYAEPGRMKPNPEPIIRALVALDARPSECVLIGDSLTDITGSHAAGVPVIGYANKPAKADMFAGAKADAVVASMADIAMSLVEHTAS